MRVSRLLLLPLAAIAVTACSNDDGVTTNARPPLGGVRLINAVPDFGAVDIRMVDQVEWSVSSVTTSANTGLPFRAATIHWATEAKARHIRVFPTSNDIAVASQILVDTTITVVADKNVTWLLVGSGAAGGSMRFVQIDDDVPTLTQDQLAARIVSASAVTPSAIDGYFVATTSTAITAMTPTFAAVPSYSASQYAVRGLAAFAARITAAGTTTPVYSATAPAGAVAADGISATAGYKAGFSGLSAYMFPKACPTVTATITAANCPAAVGQSAANITAYNAPAVIWFVDQIPPPVTLN